MRHATMAAITGLTQMFDGIFMHFTHLNASGTGTCFNSNSVEYAG